MPVFRILAKSQSLFKVGEGLRDDVAQMLAVYAVRSQSLFKVGEGLRVRFGDDCKGQICVAVLV